MNHHPDKSPYDFMQWEVVITILFQETELSKILCRVSYSNWIASCYNWEKETKKMYLMNVIVTFITAQLATSGRFTCVSFVYTKTGNIDLSLSASTLQKQCQLSPKPQIVPWTEAESFLAEQLLRFVLSWGGHENSGRDWILLLPFTASSTNLSSTKFTMRLK